MAPAYDLQTPAWDLSPERITNFRMGILFEEPIRTFVESSNETAGAVGHPPAA